MNGSLSDVAKTKTPGPKKARQPAVRLIPAAAGAVVG